MKTVHSVIDGYALHSINDKLSRMKNDSADVYGVVMGDAGL